MADGMVGIESASCLVTYYLIFHTRYHQRFQPGQTYDIGNLMIQQTLLATEFAEYLPTYLPTHRYELIFLHIIPRLEYSTIINLHKECSAQCHMSHPLFPLQAHDGNILSLPARQGESNSLV
jgi:hypothetical protein